MKIKMLWRDKNNKLSVSQPINLSSKQQYIVEVLLLPLLEQQQLNGKDCVFSYRIKKKWKRIT